MKLSNGEIILFGLVGYLVLTPVLQYEPYGIDHLYNVKRYLQVSLLVLVGGMLFFSSAQRKQTAEFISLFPSKVYWVLGGVILIGAISSLLAAYQDWAFLEFGHWLLMSLAIFYVGSIAYKNPNKAVMYITVAVLAYVFFYLCRVSFFYMLYQLGEVPLWPGDLNRKALYSFSHTRFFNQTQTWTIPLLVSLGWYYWKYSKINLYRIGMIILISFWGALVFASGGRGTILGVVVGICIVFTLHVNEKRQFLSYCFATALLSFLSYYLFFSILAAGTKESVQRISSSGRFDNWVELIPEILSKPILGYGPMHYSAVYLENSWGHPHNWFLQFSYEWGLLVAIALLSLFLCGLFKVGRQIQGHLKDDNYDSEKLWIKIGLFWSTLAAFTHGLFSGVAVMPLSQMWFVLIVGTLIGLYFKESYSLNFQKRNPSKKVELVLALVIIVGIAGLVNWGINNPISRSEVDAGYNKNSVSSRSHPRYWQQGKFGDM